jgi:hypothetical protein
MATLLITLFAGLVTFLFLAAVIFESPQDRMLVIQGVRISMKKFSAGIMAYFMGLASLATWARYLVTEFHANRPHVFSITNTVFQFTDSVLLLIAGHAVIRGWRHHGGIFFFVLGITMVVAMISLMTYNLGTQPEGLYMVLGVVQVAGSVFGASFYAAEIVFSNNNVKKTPSERHRTYVD